jgi:DNA replication protein DnaC
MSPAAREAAGACWRSEAQAEHRLSRLEAQLDRLDLLICDELGFIRLDADQAQLLFILLAHRYTRGGLIITSNLEFGDWTGVFNDDARLVSALLDRLLSTGMGPVKPIDSALQEIENGVQSRQTRGG